MDIKAQPLLVPLTDITADATLQPRVGGIDSRHVEELSEAGEALPPIVAVRHNDKYRLVDGFHRFELATKQGLKSIPVILLDVRDNADLQAIAFNLNASHGLPLTLKDRQAEVARRLKADPGVSNRELARQCGIAPGTVDKIRGGLVSTSQIPETAQRIGRDGRTYTSEPRRSGKQVGLSTLINNVADALDPRPQRKIVRYIRQLVDTLEQQDDLEGFDSIDDAALACRTILGEQGSKELAARLGWSAGNIFEIAKALGYRAEGEP